MHETKIQVSNYHMNVGFYKPAQAKDAVVFIHGISTNAHLWDSVIPYLDKDYAVLAVDLIGYGKSDRGPYYDLTYFLNKLFNLSIPRRDRKSFNKHLFL